MKTIVVTGADGFIGKNFVLRLNETQRYRAAPITRATPPKEAEAEISRADVVVHLAGVNRPTRADEFAIGNLHSTRAVIDAVRNSGRRIPIIFASSVKAADPGPYGESKRAAEDALLEFSTQGHIVHIFRLPNVFGKWCRPNYNSAVATFCHNIARDLPIEIHDPAAPLSLVYIDDVVDAFLAHLEIDVESGGFREVQPQYATTVGELADVIRGFRSDRDDALIDAVGFGLKRALYATYVAALPTGSFSYSLVSHRDPRGAFSEVLKTRTSGQFSYFTALPGVTRGGHYHHTKTEKFLVVQGEALFRFRHMISGDTFEIRTSGSAPVVVETVPGWSHDITNTGEGLLIALLWANEIFDRGRPDTIAAKV